MKTFIVISFKYSEISATAFQEMAERRTLNDKRVILIKSSNKRSALKEASNLSDFRVFNKNVFAIKEYKSTDSFELYIGKKSGKNTTFVSFLDREKSVKDFLVIHHSSLNQDPDELISFSNKLFEEKRLVETYSSRNRDAALKKAFKEVQGMTNDSYLYAVKEKGSDVIELLVARCDGRQIFIEPYIQELTPKVKTDQIKKEMKKIFSFSDLTAA